MDYFLLISLIGILHVREVIMTKKCACATTDVHVREGAGVMYNILGTLPAHQCVESLQNHQKDSNGDSWEEVHFHNNDGWIHEHFIHLSYKSDCSGSLTVVSSGHSVCPKFISRDEWHARSPTWSIPLMPHAPKYVIIHHGETGPCYNKVDCIHKVQAYQNYHMDTHGWPDIGFNFIVGEDGNVYEGRGWKEVGAHTHGYNDVGIGICIIGDFSHRTPNDAALTAVKDLVNCGLVSHNHRLDSNYSERSSRCGSHRLSWRQTLQSDHYVAALLLDIVFLCPYFVLCIS